MDEGGWMEASEQRAHLESELLPLRWAEVPLALARALATEGWASTVLPMDADDTSDSAGSGLLRPHGVCMAPHHEVQASQGSVASLANLRPEVCA